MPIAIDPKQTHDFILERERARPSAEQTRFKIRALTAAAERDCGLAEKESTNHLIHCGLRHGLAGWENFKLADGSDAPFSTHGPDESKQPTDATLSRLHFTDKVELFGAIRALGLSTFTEAERGK